MMKRLERMDRTLNGTFWNKQVTQKRLAQICAAVFFASLIPLVLIALYNYPADDDFGFTLPAATAWIHTHSIPAVFSAIVQKTVETYQTWQGNFVSTFLFSVNPLIWNIRLYFISNWVLLALLCLSVGYLVKSVMQHYLKASRVAFWIIYSAIMVLMLQFMPSIGDSVYWHNGGQYTVAGCTLMLAYGLLLRCDATQSRKRNALRGILLALCGFMLGGSFYGPALGAFVGLALITLAAFATNDHRRWHALAVFLCFCVAFGLSVVAPGVHLRQERTGETTGVVYALYTTVLDSMDVAGKFLTPQLFAMLMLILPTAWKPLRDSGRPFRHPVWFALMLYGAFAASLTPGIYTGYGYETTRYYNVIYFYCLLFVIGSALYAEGACIRWMERKRASNATFAHLLDAGQNMGDRFLAGYLALSILLLGLGGFGYTIMNTASISATKSLITGEAAQFHREMEERQEYIRITDSDAVAVRPLSVHPSVFKTDRLPFQGIYGRVRYMKWYFELFYQQK